MTSRCVHETESMLCRHEARQRAPELAALLGIGRAPCCALIGAHGCDLMEPPAPAIEAAKSLWARLGAEDGK